MNLLPGLLSSAVGGAGGIGGILSKVGNFVGNVLEDVGEGKVKSFSDLGKSLATSGAEVLTGKTLPGSLNKVMKDDKGEPLVHASDELGVFHKPDPHEAVQPKSISEMITKTQEPMQALQVHTTAAGFPSTQTMILPKDNAELVKASNAPLLTDTFSYKQSPDYLAYKKYKRRKAKRSKKKSKKGNK